MNQFKKPLLRDALAVSEAPAAPTSMATDADPGGRASSLAEADANASASATPEHEQEHEHENEPLWQASSFDLRSGADITDFSDTIPTELFDRWFKG